MKELDKEQQAAVSGGLFDESNPLGPTCPDPFPTPDDTSVF